MMLGAGEIVMVLAVALMVLGPQKMPEVARRLARFVGQFRRLADEVRSQVDDALAEPPKPPSSPVHEAPTLAAGGQTQATHAAQKPAIEPEREP